jgi:hypothetical protein
MGRSNYRDRYEHLSKFFVGYFNKFWTTVNTFDGPPSDRGVIAQAAKECAPKRLREVRAQLRAILAEPLDEAALGDILRDEFGNAYDPSPEGLSKREWLRKIDEFIGEELTAKRQRSTI